MLKHRKKLLFYPSGGTLCQLCNYDKNALFYGSNYHTESLINSHPHFTQTDRRGGWQNFPRREPGSILLVHYISVMVRFLITTFKMGVENIFLSLADTHHT
jgi:hypothetical protein